MVRYYIAVISELNINGKEYEVFEGVVLNYSNAFCDTKEEAVQAIKNLGKPYTRYTIIEEFYITD